MARFCQLRLEVQAAGELYFQEGTARANRDTNRTFETDTAVQHKDVLRCLVQHEEAPLHGRIGKGDEMSSPDKFHQR